MDIKSHWNKIYAHKHDAEVSWYQKNPETSVAFIETYAKSKTSNIIDIGGGNSELSKTLCSLGYKSLAILDISEEAIERSRAKIRSCKGITDFYTTDILSFKPSGKFNIWHDRAVFHFLTQKKEIDTYVKIAAHAIEKNGYLLLSTFSLTGPETCSELSVSRYSTEMLKEIFAQKFEFIESVKETHITPMNTKQSFVWVILKKNNL